MNTFPVITIALVLLSFIGNLFEVAHESASAREELRVSCKLSMVSNFVEEVSVVSSAYRSTFDDVTI